MTVTTNNTLVGSRRILIGTILRHRASAPLAIGLLAFTISVIGIGIPSVWYDEAATVSSATRSLPQLWNELGNVDAVHGLYYFLMHEVFAVFGYSPVSLRMPSALALAATAALLPVLGRQLDRARLGWIAGLVFCVIPRATWMGAEGRSYALTALLAVAMTIAFVEAQKIDSRRWWAAYAVLALVGVTLFIYLALVVLAHGVTVAWLAARRAPQSARHARYWLFSAAVAGVASLPFVGETVSQTGQVAWLAPLGPATLQQVLVEQWFYTSVPFAVVGWALVLVGLVALSRRRSALPTLALVVPALIVPTLALLAATAVSHPIYLPRYLSMCVPFLALAMAAGIDSLRNRAATIVALALLVALAVPQVVQQRSPEAKDNSSWSQVADFIATERASDGADATTAIVYGNAQRHPGATARVIAYSYPQAFAGTIDVTLATPAAETAQLWETRSALIDSLARLDSADITYFVTSNARDQRAETTATLESHGWHLDGSWNFTAVHVLRYVRDLPRL